MSRDVHLKWDPTTQAEARAINADLVSVWCRPSGLNAAIVRTTSHTTEATCIECLQRAVAGHVSRLTDMRIHASDTGIDKLRLRRNYTTGAWEIDIMTGERAMLAFIAHAYGMKTDDDDLAALKASIEQLAQGPK